MHEPFASNGPGNLGTASLLKHLDSAQRAVEEFNNVSNLEPEATNLLEQITDLVDVTSSLDGLATRERRNPSAYSARVLPADLLDLHSVCSSTTSITQECVEIIEPLRSRLDDIRGCATTESRLGSQDWYDEMYEGLKLRSEVLQVLFTALNVLRHKNDIHEDGQLSAETLRFANTLQYQIDLVNRKLCGAKNDSTALLRVAVAAATGVTLHVPTSSNIHFEVDGKIARTFYTGRGRQMATLQAAFEDTSYPGQKRFVIYGLGGSGKTELALKYAENYMHHFWGVFLVDGSSRKAASGSYLNIAKIGGVEPNEKAAKNWLTTRASPWLLIIDNVDEEEVQLEELLPVGTKGSILVTTRNPTLKSYGTVGKRSLELLEMETEEANELILRAAEEPSPWAKGIMDSASVICKALGFLPLALVHAGKAILLGLCPWTGPDGYLAFYDRHVERIRRARLHRRNRSLSRSRIYSVEDKNMNVFSSYEILYDSLNSSQGQKFQDAVELLHVFSFLHFQNIRLDIFVNAAINPLKEAKHIKEAAREDEKRQKNSTELRQKTWFKWLREQIFRAAQNLAVPPPLPAVLRNQDDLDESSFSDEVRDRLSEALVVLVSRSLITKQDRLESRYYMHPLVHKWIRERPEMSASHQALWCQVATTILANDILLPPLGDMESDRTMRRELLPHILQVRACQQVINDRLEKNRNSRKAFWQSHWPVVKTDFGRLQALEAARFSRVYSECGLFNEALQLQSKVRTFAMQRLGEEHPICIQITLFLTSTLRELSQTAEATRLQRRLYDVCLESLGQDHPLTLKVTDLLGSILCFRGKWTESLTLHQKAIEGLRGLPGKEFEKLKATNNLALAYLRSMDFQKASELHQVAWEGMKNSKQLGPLHVETLLCLEDLAMSRIRLGEQYLSKSHDMMTFILEQRRKALGKEQPYTLLAMCNLGRVKSAMGQHDEAARIMGDALPIAERNLGEDHFGVLAGKTHYAQVLVRLGLLKEAEEMFHTVLRKPQYRENTGEDGEHPDHIIASWYLTGCLERQGKFRQALEVCQGMVESLQRIGGQGLGMKHKFAEKVHDEAEKLKRMIQDNVKTINEDQNIPGEL